VAPQARRNLLIFGPLGLSWVFAVACPWLSVLVPWRDLDEGPMVPYVGSVPWTRQTDVMSSVPGLFMILLVAAVAVAIAEVAKAFLPCRQTGAFLLISIYQVILALDILRAYAPDWWVFLTFFLGVRSKSPPLLPGIGTPWIALTALLMSLLHLAFRLRSGSGDQRPARPA
jgi:hypothetical protein